MAPVGDDGELDVVALLWPAAAFLDVFDAPGQYLLVGAERVARLGRDELTLAALDARQFQVVPQIILEHDIRDGAEHIDQLGDVDKLREALDRLVAAGGLQLELGAGVAESGRPGVELVNAALVQQALVLEPRQRAQLADRYMRRKEL